MTVRTEAASLGKREIERAHTGKQFQLRKKYENANLNNIGEKKKNFWHGRQKWKIKDLKHTFPRIL